MVAHMKHVLLLLVLAVLLVACSHPKHAAIPAGATVLVLGDSVSYGTGANPGEDYPALLAARTGWNIINAGVPGDTTADGLERLPALLEEHAPKLVLVELGGNDFLRQVPRQETVANLKSILTQITAKGIPAVLVGVPRPNLLGAAVGSLSDDPIFAEIGKETATPVVEEVLSDVLAKNALKADPIHPNAEGYRKVAEGMREALQKLGFVR